MGYSGGDIRCEAHDKYCTRFIDLGIPRHINGNWNLFNRKNCLFISSTIGSSDKNSPFNSPTLLLQISKPVLFPSWVQHHLLKRQHKWETRCLAGKLWEWTWAMQRSPYIAEVARGRGIHRRDRDGPVMKLEGLQGNLSQKLRWESFKKGRVSGQETSPLNFFHSW